MGKEIIINNDWVSTRFYIVEEEGNDNLNISDKVTTAEFRFLLSQVGAYYQIESEEDEDMLGKTVIYLNNGQEFIIDIFFSRLEKLIKGLSS